MKKLLLSLLVLVCGAMRTMAQVDSDFEKMKHEIVVQLLSDSSNDKIVADLATEYFPNGIDVDQCLMELVAYSLPKDSNVRELLSTQNEDGSWDDVYYTSPSRSAWEAQQHIKNIMTIARSYKFDGSTYYNDPKVKDALVRAIEYWCDNGFECDNWWYNAIGVPIVFAPTLLLLEDDISAELMAKGIKILEPAERKMTGQNKVWVNGVTLIKGLLLGDRSIVERTSTAIREELRQSKSEGIQFDYSYHQHGAQQQFGNYGLAFASSLSYWMRVLDGTSYDFSDEQKEIMRNYILQGLNVTIWKGYMDVSSCARQLFENAQAGKAASLLISNLNMMHLDGDKEGYEQYIVRNYLSPENNDLVGNFAYPISKYTIHRAKDFFFSVKMCSERVIGGEITNNENLKGYHLADGATMIYRTGKEYDNIFAIWDGKYMPGTTVELNDKPLKHLVKGKPYYNGSSFVGCMSDGEFGLTAMEYVRDGVEANKSWFSFGDQVVCLGNGAKAESGEELVTTLNQCNYQNGAYYLKGKRIVRARVGEKYNAQRVFSDGIGYESIDGSLIEFGAREQSGDWHDVAEFYPVGTVSGDVFTAQIIHKDSYGYVVKPTTEKNAFLKGESKDDFRVICNDGTATAVESADGERVMVVFWSAGEVETSGCGTVSSPEPMMVMVKRDGGELVKTQYNPL